MSTSCQSCPKECALFVDSWPICEECYEKKYNRPAFAKRKDAIDRPEHYTAHPSKIECITITEHMSFLMGNIIKYVWRADLKNGLEDLKKARWYLDREISKRESREKSKNQ